MEFCEVIAKRRSVRHFNTKLAVSDEDVRALLEAAVTAPTAGNIQPWRFVVVRSAEARERLAAALHQRWATAAPVVIVVCVDPRPCAARYGDRGEMLYAIQDTAAAVENILLAAVDRGLASCWIGAFDEEAVARRSASTPPITPVADPADRVLGRVGGQAGAPAARRGHDVALEGRRGDVPSDLGCAASTSCASSSATVTAVRSATRARRSCSASAIRTRELMFIGEAPGQERGPEGRAVRGRGRQAARRAAREHRAASQPGLHRQRAQVPSAGQPRSAAGRDRRRARRSCAEQIRLIDPEVIATLGNFATKYVLGTDARHHAAARASSTTSTAGRCVPIFHPAAALYDAGEARRRSSTTSGGCAP